MSSPAHVTIHPSQFPDRVRRDLLLSLRSRQVNHKFHYDTVKQTQKWLALHDAFSPARTDPDCAATYDAAFTAAANQISAARVHLIALGCGGGQKDLRLLQLLRQNGKQTACTLSDVGAPMVLVARAAVLDALPDVECHTLVCDLATADDLPEILAPSIHPDAARLVTFFGMIPNFEPQIILPRLAALLRPTDYLLFSANLAPGPDYAAGVQRILPLYDNDLTREWLLTFLLDLGVERTDGSLNFSVEDSNDLKRIVANFKFSASRQISIDRETFAFRIGDAIRLFFSYRHTPGLVRTLLAPHGIKVLDQWITQSGEEGVFLCQRA
ncbi:MAG TPA: L-histidine N(alpha)-methyltransferase [Verrucomicrobiae bacterium]|nr:L-histidine N(alpha)-methyltransferase [Verrucomicrobiae bacterium]